MRIHRLARLALLALVVVACNGDTDTAEVPSKTPASVAIQPSSTVPDSTTQSTSYAITGPLVIDSEGGRIYAPGRIGEQDQTLVLAASDGLLLATYPVTGLLALDALHGWLYVDQGERGVAVLNAQTGVQQASTRDLPEPTQGDRPAPQADTANGQGLAYRDTVVYVLDPLTGAILRTLSTDVRLENSGALPIKGMLYDSATQILYLTYDYSPAQYYAFAAVVSSDLASGREIARQNFSSALARDVRPTAAPEVLYGTTSYGTWPPSAYASLWAWHQGSPWFLSTNWTKDLLRLSPQVDARRGHLYAATASELLVFDATTMALLLVAPRPEGSLAGYDPQTDQLYFVTQAGELRPWPASAIAAPRPQPLGLASPPALPVRAIAVTPGGQEAGEPFMAGLWQHSDSLLDAMVLGRSAGDLYLDEPVDDRTVWQGPSAGPTASNPQFTAIALSPDYAHDRTILAGVQGLGVFRSIDGAQSWQASADGLESMRVDGFLISNGFAKDHTVFVDAMRSRDAGRTWQALGVTPCQITLSPEFADDQTVAASTGETCRELQVSQDGGDTWQEIGQLPGEGQVSMLSLAPLYARWRVVFSATQPPFEHPEQGATLYRSEDGGRSWQPVLQTPVEVLSGWPYLADLDLVYAPGNETQRSVYLLATQSYDPGWNTATGYTPSEPPKEPGLLYVSEDGGQTWQQANLPPSLVPTALAISPNFAEDQLLYLGTKDGQIVPIAATSLTRQLGE